MPTRKKQLRSRPSGRSNEQVCRLCLTPIVLTGECRQADDTVIKLAKCLCHDYIYDEGNRKWNIVLGTKVSVSKKKRERAKSPPTNYTPKPTSQRRVRRPRTASRIIAASGAVGSP